MRDGGEGVGEKVRLQTRLQRVRPGLDRQVFCLLAPLGLFAQGSFRPARRSRPISYSKSGTATSTAIPKPEAM
jgi:hypothetical protein